MSWPSKLSVWIFIRCHETTFLICSMRREEKLRQQPQFGGISDAKSFSTKLGDSFRGFLFGGGGARGEDGSVGVNGRFNNRGAIQCKIF